MDVATKPTAVISPTAQKKINYLCARFPNLEWSGIMFYTVTDCIVNIIDFIPLNLGTSSFTEFSDNPDVLSFRIEHDLLQSGVYEGLIHSHNTMASFFSGTDSATMKEQSEAYDYYISLIVNNAGQYVAKCSTHADVSVSDSMFGISETKKKTIITDLNLEYNFLNDEKCNDDDFIKACDKIQKIADEEARKAAEARRIPGISANNYNPKAFEFDFDFFNDYRYNHRAFKEERPKERANAVKSLTIDILLRILFLSAENGGYSKQRLHQLSKNLTKMGVGDYCISNMYNTLIDLAIDTFECSEEDLIELYVAIDKLPKTKLVKLFLEELSEYVDFNLLEAFDLKTQNKYERDNTL